MFVAAAVALLVLAAVVAVAISASGGPTANRGPVAAASPSSSDQGPASSAPGGIVSTPDASASHALSGSVTVGSPATSAAPPSAQVTPDIKCESTEQVDYHVHAHLAIVIDGKPQTVPADIGITSLCLYWLHTHADSGMIHVEAPVEVDFRLGQFFDIWREPLDAQNLGPYPVASGSHLFAFVNGAPWTADPRSIPLPNHQVIELQVGQEPLPPSPYQFPAGY